MTRVVDLLRVDRTLILGIGHGQVIAMNILDSIQTPLKDSMGVVLSGVRCGPIKIGSPVLGGNLPPAGGGIQIVAGKVPFDLRAIVVGTQVGPRRQLPMGTILDNDIISVAVVDPIFGTALDGAEIQIPAEADPAIIPVAVVLEDEVGGDTPPCRAAQ